MQIRFDQHGREHITTTKTEIRKIGSVLKLLEVLSRATGDTELRQTLDVIRKRFPVISKEDDF